MHDFADDIVAVQRIPEVEAMLAEVCALTGMGFAAVARVTHDRWVVCQLLDSIEFGLHPGDELQVQTTICSEIRASGRSIYIDAVSANPLWRTHHTPALYGFESYISIPIVLADGSFFGTLCAIDPAPRSGLAEAVIPMEKVAARIADALGGVRLAVSR